jgi:L-arabinose isomerase
MADMEFLLINGDTKLADFKKELQWNEAYRAMAYAIR